jgi:PAS domain S-box-containing protein
MAAAADGLGGARYTGSMADPWPGGPQPRGPIAPDDTTFRLFVDSVQDYAIFMLDPDGRVVSWNRGAERIKGYREDEIVGQHFSRFYPPEAVARGWPEHELAVARREGRFEDEGWRVRKDGSQFWANVVITAVRDADGRLRGFAKVTRDMTDRKRAERQAAELAREQAAHAEAQRANERLQAVVEVSRALGEAGLSFDTVAATIARRLAELLGDGCVIRVVREGSAVPVASFHTDPEAARLWGQILTPLPLDADNVITQAIRARTSVQQSGPQLAAITVRDFPAYERFTRRFPPTAILVAPMIVPGGETVGTLSLIRTSGGDKPYSDEDRLVVEALAFRSALALTHASLYAEARAAYAEARDAHQQLRLTFAAMAEGVLVQDSQGHIVMANDAAARLCGYPSAADLLAAPVGEVVRRFEVFGEDGQPLPLETLPARRALGGEQHAEALMRWRPKGTTMDRWSISKATPVRDAEGQVRYAISVIEDITDRRRAFERLQFLSEAGEILSSSLAYERTLASMAQLAVPRIADWCTVDICDEKGVRRLAVAHVDPTKVVWAEELNRRYPVDLQAPRGIGAVLRTGQPELIGEIPDDMLAASTRDPDQLRILQELGLRSYICVPLSANGRTIGALTLLATDESGRRYDEHDLTMATLLGRRAGLAVENARLYTDTHRALEEVTTISRTKDEFLATLSHELRTPLNAIVGWVHLLMSGNLSAEQSQKAIATIARNAKLQAQLIGDMVDVSRIVSGKVRLDVRPIDPVAVIQSALDTVAPAAAARNIRVEAVLNPDAGPISGDAERLQQVVWNLLSNAIKFTPKGGHVQVRLEAVNSHVEIIVEDNGPGIPADFLPHVFERFRQADSSSTRSHKGLGLGLAIVRHLVELHGGSVRAQNRSGQTGAVFTVALPRRAVLGSAVADARPGVAAAGSTPDTGPSLRGIRVMLVDDEPDARELLALGLEQSGAEVRAFGTAAEVQRELLAFRPHVLLADIEMPGTDGYTLLRELRALAPEEGALTPAIAITAYAGTEDRIRALSAGFDLHLSKPVQLPELRAAVARLAGQRR